MRDSGYKPLMYKGVIQNPCTDVLCGCRHVNEVLQAAKEKSLGMKLPAAETRATDPQTGGEKGVKLAQLGAVDPLSLTELSKVAGFGAVKYARYNFLKGYPWSWSYDALQRHLLAFWSGEDTDPESQQLHLAHAMWHCAALISFSKRSLGTDDRPPKV